MNDLHKKVFMLLPIGVHSSISTKEIEMILGIQERYVREIINNLIMEYGIPIGSFRHQNNGFFIATSEEEKTLGTYSLAEQVNTMKQRLNRIKDTDLETAMLYREKYKNDIKDYDKQSNIYEYIHEESEEDIKTEIIA